ncbi:MAG: RNA-binding protein [Euryarchaeota archaeon RBG_19FT_COMBO_56_21]|nr:MAG: RNA-binding protein [Euryarchaeota archaeon RBG_19FT_COMBO_56_21]
MSELHLRKRHRLRQKEIVALSSELDTVLGTRTFTVDDTVDMAESQDYEVVFVNGKILAFKPDGRTFLTVRGFLKYTATKRFITVDMGAVKFVYNGANVMGPGIVGFDSEIKEGDLVWIRDVKNLRPLAVGKALVSAQTMALKEKGKAVVSIHHVGDKLWMLDEPKDKEEPAGEKATDAAEQDGG